MFTRAEELLREGIEKGLYSGAALGVVKDASVLTTVYLGKESFEEEANAIDRETLFDIASLTKIVVTTSIALRFLDRGLIRLEDTVGYFFQKEATTTKNITIRQLLTHTSGIPAHFLLSSEVEEPSQIIPHILTRPLEHKPGEVQVYSCMGYILLGGILAKVSGKSLEDLYKEEVQDVLGLEKAQYGPVEGKVAKTKDLSTREVLSGVVHDENARFHGGISANAGLFSNLEDLLKYTCALVNNGFIDQEFFISPVTLDIARENYTAGMEQDRGLGFFLASTTGSSFGDLLSKTGFGHTGFTGTSILMSQDEGIGIVILTNRVLADNDGAEVNRLRALINNAIVSEIITDEVRDIYLDS